MISEIKDILMIDKNNTHCDYMGITSAQRLFVGEPRKFSEKTQD